VEGQPDASCRAYQEAIAVLRKIPGGHAPLVGALADLAGYELSIGRCRAAERHAKESLQILRKYEVQEPKTRLKARIAVAAVYMEKGRITAAAELYREILKEANAASVHSQLEPLVVVAMLNMADQLLVSNPKATRDILDPLLMQLATAGPEYEPFLILARVVEAHWYHATGNKTKAAALASEALHHAEAVFPPNDLVLAQFRLIAAEIFLAAENHGEAERQVSAAIRTWDMYRANSQHLLAALVCHSTALRKLGRPKEAAATEDRIARLSHSMEAIERENTVDISILRAGQGGLP
jgi:tetratricopeptide (TPR) repeat protein